jgi:hypothetical protein
VTLQRSELCSREMNTIHVLVSNSGQLLHLDVNTEYPNRRNSDLRQRSMNEKRLGRRKSPDLYTPRAQVLAVHIVGRRHEQRRRLKVEAAVKQELFTLVNLTKEHLKDRDKEKCNCKREFVKP